MESVYKKLPGHELQFVAVRECVERVAPGVFDRLPFSCRVFTENVLRKCSGQVLESALDQIVQRKTDADFPYYPARVVL